VMSGDPQNVTALQMDPAPFDTRRWRALRVRINR